MSEELALSRRGRCLAFIDLVHSGVAEVEHPPVVRCGVGSSPGVGVLVVRPRQWTRLHVADAGRGSIHMRRSVPAFDVVWHVENLLVGSESPGSGQRLAGSVIVAAGTFEDDQR